MSYISPCGDTVITCASPTPNIALTRANETDRGKLAVRPIVKKTVHKANTACSRAWCSDRAFHARDAEPYEFDYDYIDD